VGEEEGDGEVSPRVGKQSHVLRSRQQDGQEGRGS
jgi:hypothetical protein